RTMSFEDYQKGQQDPWGVADISKPGGWDFQQGQFDAAKKAMSGQTLPPPPATQTAVPSQPVPWAPIPPRPQRKGIITGFLLTAVFGPLGLFYASKKGAVVLLLALCFIPFLVNHPLSSGSRPELLLAQQIEAMRVLWPISVVPSVIWSVVAV